MIKNNKGFTLIELIIVIVILGILAGIAAPNMIGNIKKTKVSTVFANVTTVNKAVAQWYAENTTTPNAANLETLMNNSMTKMGISLNGITSTPGGITVNYVIDATTTGVTNSDITAKAVGQVGSYTAGAGNNTNYTITLQ